MAPLDELLLAEAREAQAAQVHAQAQAELARVRFAGAVRRLHAGGASMREIARAFGLSHQRVHQLIGGDDGRLLSCSFCGTHKKQARKLIAGPGVFICERCVALAAAVVDGSPAAEKGWAAQRRGGPPTRPLPGSGKGQADDRCSFCGKARSAVSAMADGVPFRICAECLELCAEIIAEELGE